MTTSNLSGEKLTKNALQIHLVGTLDELNAHIGLVKVKINNEKDKKFLEAIQINLMKLMSHASDTSNNKFRMTEETVLDLENEIKSLKDNLPQDSKFVIPGQNETEALVHIARTVTRRAERYFVAVCEKTQMCQNAAFYLNKLSEYLFYLAQGTMLCS